MSAMDVDLVDRRRLDEAVGNDRLDAELNSTSLPAGYVPK